MPDPTSVAILDSSDYAKPVAFAAASRETYRLADKVAATDVAVLITGESGTGKEVLARFVHDHSPRASAPFVAVNCAAIPENMLESTLFGHERGAFTGAVTARPGKFSLADAGTLLLDEISEMPLTLQAKLLRVVQEREVEPLGARFPKPVDVRLIATSNRDLPQAVRQGQFREDLYYRLSVFPLAMAPLRARIKDIWPLAQRFVKKHQRIASQVTGLQPVCQPLLESYRWPGNVRELENVIQRALVVAAGQWITPDELGLDALTASIDVSENGLEANLSHAEQSLVLQTLRTHHGNRQATAKALGISDRTLRYKLAKLRERGVVT